MKSEIFLAQRAPAESYPPVLNQAKLLQALGNVTVLDSASPGPDFLTSAEVRRIRIPLSTSSGRSARLRRLNAAWLYRKALMGEIRAGAGALIAFEPETAAMVLGREMRLGKFPFTVVHLHEHPTADAYAASAIGRWSLQRTLSRLKYANAVVVADAHRAQELMKLAALTSLPMVVMNCPLLLNDLPESRLLPLAASRGHTRHIIHYHGAIGPDHGLETTIASMRWWPPDSAFYIVGGGDASYIESLMRLASAAGAADRVVFVGRVPYDQVFSFAVGASLGISMLDTAKPNWRYAAGASNKRFEYMALGIPQITSPGPGIADLFEKTGVALLADPNEPRDVARQIAAFLESPNLRQSASESARALHKSVCNYENQFRPVRDLVSSHIGSASRRPA